MTSTHRPVSRASLAVAAFSTIVEWYDFTLYLYFATVLSRVFFGGGAQSLLITLAGFAIRSDDCHGGLTARERRPSRPSAPNLTPWHNRI